MSEHASHPAEKHERKTSTESHVEAPRQHEQEKHHETTEREKRPDKHELEQRVHKEAKSRHETPIGGHEQENQTQSFGVHKDFKMQAYNQVLRKVRSHLKPAERAFSKVIHQPVVEAVSELSSKTIARPSAILGGGITAFIGSGVILYMGKHYGFEYNFFVYILLLLVGFGAGIVLEFFINGVRSKN